MATVLFPALPLPPRPCRVLWGLGGSPEGPFPLSSPILTLPHAELAVFVSAPLRPLAGAALGKTGPHCLASHVRLQCCVLVLSIPCFRLLHRSPKAAPVWGDRRGWGSGTGFRSQPGWEQLTPGQLPPPGFTGQEGGGHGMNGWGWAAGQGWLGGDRIPLGAELCCSCPSPPGPALSEGLVALAIVLTLQPSWWASAATQPPPWT